MKTLFTEQQIRDRVWMLASEIGARYSASNGLHLVSILKDSVVFTTDLMRALPIATTVNFVFVKSDMLYEIDDVGDKDVLIIDGLVSSGYTLHYIVQEHKLRPRPPRSIQTVALVNQPSCRLAYVQVDYSLFTIDGDKRVVGYGIDYDEHYRELPHIVSMEK